METWRHRKKRTLAGIRKPEPEGLVGEGGGGLTSRTQRVSGGRARGEKKPGDRASGTKNPESHLLASEAAWVMTPLSWCSDPGGQGVVPWQGAECGRRRRNTSALPLPAVDLPHQDVRCRRQAPLVKDWIRAELSLL